MVITSVIIPTYNEVEVIKECLVSLDNQLANDFEVIVVDDGSDDNTPEVLQELKFKSYDLKVVKQVHNGAGAARNLGTKYASGKILVFVDADMTFDKGFIKNLVRPIKSGRSRGTFSKDEYVSNWDNVWARCWNINEGWQKKHRHPMNSPNHQPVFRAILKSEFNKVGGFTSGGYDDDWSLSKKLGYDATLAKDAFFYHKNPSSLAEIFKHAKWVGKRKYKFGLLGHTIALLRATFPISLLIGLYKSFINLTVQFIVFKLVYDFGVFIGILEYLMLGKTSK